MKVDKARPGDVDAFDGRVLGKGIDNEAGDFTRVFLRGFRKAHRDIAGEVAVARVARSLHRIFDSEIRRGAAEFGQTGEGVLDELRDSVFHQGSGGGLRGGNSTRLFTRMWAPGATLPRYLEKFYRVDIDRPAHLARYGVLLQGRA